MYHWLSLRWLVLSSGRFATQHDEHIAVQTRPAVQEFHFSRQATLQPQLIIYSTYPVCGCSMDSCNKRQRAISYFPALLLSAKADDIVEASSKLYGIIVILGGFRWIHNERYLDVNTFERLLMPHTIEHYYNICSVDMLMPEHYAHIFSQQHPWQHWYSIYQAWWMRYTLGAYYIHSSLL